MRRTLASIQYLNYILATYNNKKVGQTAADVALRRAVKSADYKYSYLLTLLT